MKYIIGFDMFTGDLARKEIKEFLKAPGVEILEVYPLKKDYTSVDLEGTEPELKALLKTLQMDVDPEINIDMILKSKTNRDMIKELENEVGAGFNTVLASFHAVANAYGEDEDDEDYDGEEDEGSDNLDSLKAAVHKAKNGDMGELEDWLAANDVEPEFRDDYSGRGMYGSTSKIAFTTGVSPREQGVGQLLSKVFTVDSMGMDYIYYTKY